MMKKINESRFEDWKNNQELTFIDRSNRKHFIEYKNKYYNYSDVCEALGVNASDMKYATDKDIITVIKKGLVKAQGKIVNEVRYDWNHIDPVTGMPGTKERPENKIQLMSRTPGRSCWIILLQNRVNLNSVGNNRYQRKVWFDRRDCTVSTSKDKIDAVHFRLARLGQDLTDGQYPAGWIYAE